MGRPPDKDVNVTVGWRKRPPKRHPILDVLGLLFAAFLLTYGLHRVDAGNGDTVFAVLASILIVAYIGGWQQQDKKGGHK